MQWCPKYRYNALRKPSIRTDLNKAYIEDMIADLNANKVILPTELELKKQWADSNLTKAKELHRLKD